MSSMELLKLCVLMHVLCCRIQFGCLSDNERGWRGAMNNRTGALVDLSKLLSVFTLVCPLTRRCENSTIADSYWHNTSRYLYACRQCSCEFSCNYARNCCPDSPFVSAEIACVTPRVFPYPPERDICSFGPAYRTNISEKAKANSYFMLQTCSTHNENKEPCENPDIESRHASTPVTSTVSGITYKNSYCALCHNETDYLPWQVRVRCLQRLDVGHYSSLTDLHTAMLDQGCIAGYEPSEHTTQAVVCKIQKPYTFEQCNQTGLWREYDSDIYWACEHLTFPFENTKNIFCFICNPSLDFTAYVPAIDSCNVTGKWQTFDVEIRKGCLNGPSVTSLSPYKNAYCMICNGMRNIRSGRMSLEYGQATETNIVNITLNTTKIHVVAKISNSDHILSRFQETVGSLLAGFDVDQALQSVQQQPYDTSDNEIHIGDTEVNVLADVYQAMCSVTFSCNVSRQGSPTLNSRVSGNAACGYCSCVDKCIYVNRCCPDKLISMQRYPYSCNSARQILQVGNTDIDSGILPEDEPVKRYKLISTCSDQQSSEMHNKCSHPNGTDPLFYIPFGSVGLPYYRNIYCAMCSGEIKYSYLYLDISCGYYVRLNTFRSLDLLVKVMRETNCSIAFVPGKTSSVCKPSSDENTVQTSHPSKPVVSKCNTTGLWSGDEASETIINACEGSSTLVNNFAEYTGLNGTVYRNVFCHTCNPDVHVSQTAAHITISSCNETGLWPSHEWDFATETACLQWPQYPRWYPYKNYYCFSCNTAHSKPVVVSTVQPLVYRALFSLSVDDWRRLSDAGNIPRHPECDNGSYDYTINSCQDLYCSSGRILENGTCNAVIDTATDIQYIVFFSLTSLDRSTSCNAPYYETGLFPAEIRIESLCEAIQISISNSVATWTTLIFLRSRIQLDNECSNKSNEDICVNICKINNALVYFEILIHHTASRTVVENTLAKADTALYNISVNETGDSWLLMKASSNENAMTLKDTPSTFYGCEYDERNTVPDDQAQETANLLEDKEDLEKDPVSIRKLMTCAQIELGPDEFSIDNTTMNIAIRNGRKIIKNGDYKFVNGTNIRLCHDDYIAVKKVKDTIADPDMMKTAYVICSYACTSVSLCCLFVTFVTYSMFRTLRTLPGKNNMNLTFLLFWAQASLQFGPWGARNSTLCTVVGGMVHYFWLATFCALNICSFHMYRVFSGSLTYSLPGHYNRRCLYYTLYTTGLPALIVLITVTVHMMLSNNTFFGYGQHACFISDKITLIAAFISPSCAIFLSNIVFFSLVFFKICTSPRVQSTRAITHRQEVVLYAKLCTITGIAWPLQILDSSLPLSVFSFFVVFINASQGLFIFLSYVFNFRVFLLYRKLFIEKRRDRTHLNVTHTYGITGSN